MSNFLKPSDVLKLEAQRYATMSNAALELDKLCSNAINEANDNAAKIVADAHAAAKEQVDAIAASLASLEEQKSKLLAEIEALKKKADKPKPVKSPKPATE